MNMSIKKHEYKKINIKDLIPYENNSRNHSDDQINQIASSIKEFGFTSPVLVDENNLVLAGHGRLRAAKIADLTEVACVVISGLSDAQKKAYCISDNKLSDLSQFNDELLRFEIEEIASIDPSFDLDILSFSEKEMSKLFDETGGVTIEDTLEESELDQLVIKFDKKSRVDIMNAINEACIGFNGYQMWCDDEQV